MSSGGSPRVPIPSGLQKTIQDIKEIARHHTDDEILAMLQECSMDPNETVQKLLFQDPFHEVKRKRDRKKENVNNREPTDSRWKPGMQGRGIRGGRTSYYPRYPSQDAGVVNAGKEDGVNQVSEKATTSPSHSTQEAENKSGVLAAGSVSGIANSPVKVAHVSFSQGSGSQMPGGGSLSVGEETSSSATTKTRGSLPPPVDTKNGSGNIVSMAQKQPTPTSDQFPSIVAVSDSGVHASGPDPVLVSSFDTDVSGLGRTIKCEVGSQGTAVEPATSKVASHKVSGPELSSKRTSAEVVSSCIQGKMPTKSLALEVSHPSDASQPLSSTFQSGSPGSKPSSNFSGRSQVIGTQKVGPSKEWKPKSLNQIPAQASTTIATSDAKVETDAQSGPVLNSRISEEATSKLQKKLEELYFSDSQHVIIPNHLQVPESERCGLSFGSFEANFGLGTRSTSLNDADSEKCSTPLTESSQGPEDNVEEPILSTQIASSAAQEEPSPEHPQSSSQMPENPSSPEIDVSLNNSAVPEYEQPKEAPELAQGGSQSSVHTAPAYSAFGLVQPMLGNQFAPFENSESQASEASRVIVQPPFDPSASYYTQIYRPGADGDGRFSPFLTHGATTKYSGNAGVLSSQMSQSTQEGVNSLVLPNTGVATQAAGVMQTSVAVTQQPVPVFRQPAGVHMSHYPPNYMPYGHYFSPFYVPTPTIHHFYSNTALPQQPLAGSMYPPPAAAATTPVKYSLSQYKSGTNSGNSNPSVMPTGHGPYNSSPTSYSPNPAVTGGNTTVNEDHTVSQYKENNIYITGQQSEGSAVWLPAPGRDIPGVQAGSFYNLPQGQQMAFGPPQAGNGAFAGIYHPTQSVGAATVHPMLQPSQAMAGAVEMVGAAAGVYQQPQRAQINWASNY